MNGIDTFLDINNAHLRVNNGNVQASTFVLDQINIVTSANTATTVNFNNVTKAFNAASNIEVGTANLFVDTTTSNVGIGTDAPAYTLDVHGSANVGALTATTFSGSGAGLNSIPSSAISGTLSQWIDINTNDIHYSAGNVGIGKTPDSGKKLDVDGTVKATTFEGEGSALTALNAANIATGTLDVARVPTLNQSTTGSAATLTTPRSIGGVDFNGSAAITPTTFGGATFSGDVTVDTDTFHVDTTNDRVGIGTTSPLETLDTYGTMRSSAPYPRLDFYTTTNRSTNVWGNSTDNAGDYRIYSNGDASDGTKRSLNFDYGQNTTHTTRMAINANGNVGIGTTSPATKLHLYDTTNEPTIALQHLSGTENNSSTNILGNLALHYSARSGGYPSVGIRSIRRASTWDDQADMEFYVRNGGNGEQTAMVINSASTNDGAKVGINKLDPGYTLDVRSDTGAHVERDDNQTYETVVAGGSIFIRNPSTSGGYEHMIINNHATGSHSTSYIQFRRGNTGNGGAIGTITGNGSTISYGTGSDYRLKTNIVPMPISGLDTINNLQPKRFNFISNPSETVDGFIAHELQEHIPMAVTGEKDEMRGRGNVVKIDDESFIVKEDVSEPDHLEEGTKWVKLTEVPVYQNVDLSKVVTYLVKAVQELSEENRTLKTRLEALENA